MTARKTLTDTIAISLVNMLRMMAQLLVVPVLSRILSPADYGIVGLAMPFVLFAMIISDSGIAVSLIRIPTSDKKIWSTCFWISIALGIVISLALLGMAPLISSLYGEPQLGHIVAALSLVIMLQAICSVPGAALQRDQRFKLIATIEVISVFIGIAVALVTALMGAGAWALAFQQLAYYAVKLVFTLAKARFWPALTLDLSMLSEHLSFGKSILGVNIIGFFSRSLDNLIIGKNLSTSDVGIYSIGMQFARLPSTLVSGPLQYVFYAKLVTLQEDKDALKKAFLALTKIISSIVCIPMMVVAVANEPVFKLLLSEKWGMSGSVFMGATVACILQSIMGICITIRMVLGKADVQMRIAFETAVIWLIALVVVIQYGVTAAAYTYSAVILLYSPRTLMMTLPLINCTTREYLTALSLPFAIGLAASIAYELLSRALATTMLMNIVLAAAIMLLGYGLCWLLQFRQIAEEWKQVNEK